MAFSDTVTGTVTWPATLPAPMNGDPGNGVNFKDQAQKIANGLVYLRSGQLIEDLFPGVSQFPSAFWDAGSANAYSQNNVGAAYSFNVPIPRPPSGLTLSTLTVYLKGAGGHADLPATVPLINLQYRDIVSADAGWVPHVIAWVPDASANKDAYQLLHPVVMNTPHVMQTGNTYCVSIAGETGANSVVGLQYWGFRIVYTY